MWLHLDALFLINIFKDKLKCCFIMDIVCLGHLHETNWDSSASNASNISKFGSSTRCATGKSLMLKKNTFFLGLLLTSQAHLVHCFYYFNFLFLYIYGAYLI